MDAGSCRATSPAVGLAPPSRLGGPKPPGRRRSPPMTLDGKTEFLRAAHQSACKLFNTVLGPEANNAHQNHFHLDHGRAHQEYQDLRVSRPQR